MPNKLTLLRIILVPVFMIFELLPVTKYHYFIALAVFIIASLTDMLDGRLARRNNQVTNFGKVMDPLADKLLVTSALVGFAQLGLGDAWVAVIIIIRELLVTSLRAVAANQNTVIAANFWGKMKTISQMIAIIAVLLFAGLSLPPFYGSILLWAAAIFTIISGIQYAWSYRNFIDINN